ncbi:hypothetical protein GOBAR_DD16728 [Gossypium barbadense]|nr:hypothetical protein GOBAR_DD16728 [Gossypium barbadense]
MAQKGKARVGDEDFVSNSPMEKRMSKSAHEGMGRIKLYHLARRRLATSPAKTNEALLLVLSKAWEPFGSSMTGCLAMSSDGCSGGLVMLWREAAKVAIESYLSNHIYSITNVIKQTKSDHDVIMLDTLGTKPKEKQKDPRLFFKFDACWAKDKRAKEIIKNVWCRKRSNILEKVDRQDEKSRICKLTEQIDRMIDGPLEMSNANSLKEARIKLGKLYAEEEGYCAQRSKIRWLKEGDRNTTIFHV